MDDADMAHLAAAYLNQKPAHEWIEIWRQQRIENRRQCGEHGHGAITYTMGEFPRCECDAVYVRGEWIIDE